MPTPVITVEGLGKRYIIGHEARHDTLRDTLAHGARGLLKRWLGRAGAARTKEEFWALRDVSFEINRGDVVGIIGRNGAGKSTLLKILSRITEPTTGSVRLRGRVASLLEVGTGFHPELSGRENIFLNGAILGMSRAEIARKFDEIVAFAEVERFLDTPVKHYSSGMYVRLAFAVAAHLEPEILIVDEVLAVGDIAFQKKCLGRMQEVSGAGGRTVLFVSHNLAAVRQLCGSALLLAGGRIAAAGPCARIVEAYQRGLEAAAPVAIPSPPPEILDRAHVRSVTVEAPDGQPVLSVPVGEPWRVRVGLRVARPQASLVVGIGLVGADGTAAQTAWHPPQALDRGDYEAVFLQDRVALEAGHYGILIGLSVGDRSLQHFEAARLEITAEGARGYLPLTAGVGVVLNSMTTTLRPATS